jgi:hypothetical protein
MSNIKTLLNKKGWTAKELGIIELTNMCSMFKQGLEGVAEPKPLVEKGQFQKMLGSITDSHQAKIYNGYISIHEWLTLHYNVRLAQEQQAQLRYKDLIGILTMAMMAEDVYQYEAQLPVIMTQKQYDDEVAAGRKLWLQGDESDPGRADSLHAMVCRAVDYYAEQLVRDPKKPNPLKPIRQKYVAEPITSPLIRARYNEAADNGYWLIEDGSGRRSDQMTDEEWQKAITTPKMEKVLEQLDLEGKLPAAPPGFSASDMAMERLKNRASFLYSGMTASEADEAQKLVDLKAGLGALTTYHLYEEFPEELTKWDVITDLITIWSIYSEAFETMNPDPEKYMEDLRDFHSEFREIIDAMLQDIDEKWYGGKAGLVDLPLEEWETVGFNWTELYERDLYGFRAETDRTELLFDGNQKAIFNGIAILQKGDFNTRHIDERGHYIPPQIQHSFTSKSLESFFPESEKFADSLDALESGRNALLDSYYYLKAFNLVIDMIAEYYGVPDLEVFKADIARIEAKMEGINEMIPLLYMSIQDTFYYHNEDLKQKKLQVLRDIFTPIDWKSLKIPEEGIETVKAYFEGFRAFKDISISDILFWRKPAAEEGEEADLHE